jgi:hypothetical protein
MNFKNNFEEKLDNQMKEEKINSDFFFYQCIIKIKDMYNQPRKNCFFCNRYIMKKYQNLQKIQLDYHINDHLMLNESCNNIPINSYFMKADVESILFDTNIQRNYSVKENFNNYSHENIFLLNEIFFHSHIIRKNKNYIFSKYRISKFSKSLLKKQTKIKTILHGWNDKKGPKKNWIFQRGEVLLGFPEMFRKKKEDQTKSFKMLYQYSNLFLIYYNKIIYELEIIKRLICIKLSGFFLKFQLNIILKFLERLNLFKYHEYLTNIFSFTIWKCLNSETNSFFRSKFFNNLFYFIEFQSNLPPQVTRSLLDFKKI